MIFPFSMVIACAGHPSTHISQSLHTFSLIFGLAVRAFLNKPLTGCGSPHWGSMLLGKRNPVTLTSSILSPKISISFNRFTPNPKSAPILLVNRSRGWRPMTSQIVESTAIPSVPAKMSPISRGSHPLGPSPSMPVTASTRFSLGLIIP